MKHQVLLNYAEQMPAHRIPSRRIAKMPRVLIDDPRPIRGVSQRVLSPSVVAPGRWLVGDTSQEAHTIRFPRQSALGSRL